MPPFRPFLNVGKYLQYYNPPKFLQGKNCAVEHLWFSSQMSVESSHMNIGQFV